MKNARSAPTRLERYRQMLEREAEAPIVLPDGELCHPLRRFFREDKSLTNKQGD